MSDATPTPMPDDPETQAAPSVEAAPQPQSAGRHAAPAAGMPDSNSPYPVYNQPGDQSQYQSYPSPEPTAAYPAGYANQSIPPQYPSAPAYSPMNPYPPAPAPQAKWNVLAIIGFILSFLVGLPGLICSIIGFNQTRRTGEKGRGLALAGIIISAVSMLLALVLTIGVLGGGIHVTRTGGGHAGDVYEPVQTPDWDSIGGSGSSGSSGSSPKHDSSSKAYASMDKFVQNSSNNDFLNSIGDAFTESGLHPIISGQQDTLTYDVFVMPTLDGSGNSDLEDASAWTSAFDSKDSYFADKCKQLDDKVKTTSGARIRIHVQGGDGDIFDRTWDADGRID